MYNPLIVAIKPEFYLTKVAVFQNSNMIFLKSVKHDPAQLKGFPIVTDQYEYRAEILYNELRNADIPVDKIKAFVGRGGLIKPIASGTYLVNEALREDLKNNLIGVHSVNLGGLVAHALSQRVPGSLALIADPVVVDELDDIARYTGFPEIRRRSIFHALSQKSVARKYAKSIHKDYEDLNLIVTMLDEGISIAAHKEGRVVDVNQAFDGEGPFALERAGSLPAGDLIQLCFSGKYSEKELLRKVRSEGGMFGYFGTREIYQLEKLMDEGNTEVKKLFEAMAYQVAKGIGSMYPVLHGNVDAILLTGVIAHDKVFIDYVSERVQKLAPVYTYPGECVLEALAMNGLMVVKGESQAKEYV